MIVWVFLSVRGLLSLNSAFGCAIVCYSPWSQEFARKRAASWPQRRCSLPIETCPPAARSGVACTNSGRLRSRPGPRSQWLRGQLDVISLTLSPQSGSIFTYHTSTRWRASLALPTHKHTTSDVVVLSNRGEREQGTLTNGDCHLFSLICPSIAARECGSASQFVDLQQLEALPGRFRWKGAPTPRRRYTERAG